MHKCVKYQPNFVVIFVDYIYWVVYVCMLCMLVNKCLSIDKQELILIKFNYSNSYYCLNKLATYVYTTEVKLKLQGLIRLKVRKSVCRCNKSRIRHNN